MNVRWKNNVVYNPDENKVVFERDGEKRSPAERIMEYLEELYPDKPWIEIAKLAVPELRSLGNVSSTRFYSL